ncbi:MAG: tetratricopeptide repeat protein [Pirellulales bacterium]|nr:tetratricopeptide repeat protein [Pirellulales bacterium]
MANNRLRCHLPALVVVLMLLPQLVVSEDAASADQQKASDAEHAAMQDQQPVEAMSLFGKPLRRRTFSPEEARKLKENLAAAKKQFAEAPNNPEHIIWHGRRLAYLWRYKDAVEVFTDGIKRHTRDPRMYRHRGHRYITLRQFDKAVADLKVAAELIAGTEDKVEPDGQPNTAGKPTSSLHTNIWYHLGLAHYLNRDYEQALTAYEKCLAAARNNDMRVATLDWMWMTLRKLGRVDDAAQAIAEVNEEMEILENHAYHRRLLMYQGRLKPEDLLTIDDAAGNASAQTTKAALDLATYGYGVGNWYAVNGQQDKAAQIFRRVTAGEHWAAFGFIASEAELSNADKD